MGAKLITGDPDKRCLYKFINNMLWFSQSFVTPDMLYGVQEEPAARVAYSKLTGYKVVETGLWVNSKYPHLGASPDGLVVDENSGAVAGIMEAKCLKILRKNGRGTDSRVSQRQCFGYPEEPVFFSEVWHALPQKVPLLLLSSTTPTVNN